MKKTIKAKWVKALKKGGYAQTTGVLNDGVGFCCLGVLCDVYAKEKKLKKPWMEIDGLRGLVFQKDDRKVLTTTVMKWAGLSETNPTIPYNERTFSLSELNDIVHLDFNKISQLIDSHF